MYPYQRSSSTASSHGGGNQSQQQQQQQQNHQRHPSLHATASPEQSRPAPMGRTYQSVHDDYRQPHPPPHNMHQQHWGPPEMSDRRDHEQGANRRWLEEPQQRSYGGPSPQGPPDRLMYPRQQQSHHPQQQQSSQTHAPYSLSHPASPSQRPRTPPSSITHPYNSHRPSPWDAAQTGPMSAPPSLVPRVNPNAHTSSSGGSSAGGAPLGSSSMIAGQQSHNHQTSPILPSLMRGSKNHSRLPSWGPHSSASNSGIPSRLDGPSSATSGAPSGSNVNSNQGSHPPPSLPFRGQSVGVGDAFGRSDSAIQQQERRKRPASDSPPNVGNVGASVAQQSSPSSRGDPMSMSSILGPSSRNNEVEKRRRLEGYPSTIKVEGGPPPPLSTSTGKMGAPLQQANETTTASNLARRKWSGPIAEQAAQQAAAWRAQEQQRWGSSRSPKVGGIAPLAGGERHASPVASAVPVTLKQGNSPSTRVDGHKRQRSDGYSGIQGSPLIRNVPMQEHSPSSPPRQQQQQHQYDHSRETSPGPYAHSMSGIPRKQPGKTHAPPASAFYRPTSPVQYPPQQQPMMHSGASNQQIVMGGNGSRQYPSTTQSYGQPSYHAYDKQGRPVEIDVDEIRGGSFAGHGLTQSRLSPERSGVYPEIQHQADLSRNRPSAGNQARNVNVAKQNLPTSGGPPNANVPAPSSAIHQQHSQQHPKMNQPGQASTQRKDREVKRRSTTPNTLGPAKGLLAQSDVIKSRESSATTRAAVPMKDFDIGPKVDSDAVWEALDHLKSVEYDDEDIVIDDEATTALGDRKNRHLGSFLYDPRRSPLLHGSLLQANVGATLEVRVSAIHLGAGPNIHDTNDTHSDYQVWSLSRQAKKSANLTNGKHGKVDEVAAQTFWNQDALVNRKLWGTDVYTDDSDVIAMCLHSGWISGPNMSGIPSWVPPGKAVLAWQEMSQAYVEQDMIENAPNNHTDIADVDEKEQKMKRIEKTADLSVMLRIAPKLIAYKGSQRSGVKSRSWGNSHDGVSLIVENVTLQESGYASGERGLRNVKNRIDHLSRLRILATIAVNNHVEDDDEGIAAVEEKVKGGGLVDIRMAAGVSLSNGAEKGKPFWMISANEGKVLA